MEDRTIIKCNDDETQCVSPSTIQPLINEAVAPIPQGRSFVRFVLGCSFLLSIDLLVLRMLYVFMLKLLLWSKLLLLL